MLERYARPTLSALMAVTLATSLLSLVGSEQSFGGSLAPCENSTFPVCGGMCPAGFACGVNETGTNATPTDCTCQVLGCCEQNSTGGRTQTVGANCHEDVTQADCGPMNLFIPGGVCLDDACVEASPTPTATPTTTPTQTPTNTPIPDGGACAAPIDCASGNCVQDVCCNTACNLPGQFCNLSGSVGTCSEPAAPVPAASNGGLAAILAALVAIGGLAVWRRRSVTH
ncbi:MAG: hypothetical protein ACRERC_01625 [Candidatus Binatia bacterium]